MAFAFREVKACFVSKNVSTEKKMESQKDISRRECFT